MERALDVFDNFLQTIWMDNTPAEACALWKYLTGYSPEYAPKVYDALEYVLDHPPADLIERMQKHGWLFLTRDDAEESVLSFQEHLDWLRDKLAELHRTQSRPATVASGSADDDS